jgi:RNA polymerase sigma-70 factor, ECF subfamily
MLIAANRGMRALFPQVAEKSPKKILSLSGNKFWPGRFTLVCVAPPPQPATFEELAMPLFEQLYNFAHWLSHNREEAEDLVQETYAKALRGFSSYQPGTNFRAWMYRILRNTFLTTRTGLMATKTVPLEPDDEGPVVVPADVQTPESILLDRSNQQLLQTALDELPVHSREILLLCEVEEMSYQEIAETLGIPVGTVMSRLSRARAALRGLVREKLKGLQKG